MLFILKSTQVFSKPCLCWKKFRTSWNIEKCDKQSLAQTLVYLTLVFSWRLSEMRRFTNSTSPPATMLSCGLAVLQDMGSGRSSLREVNVPGEKKYHQIYNRAGLTVRKATCGFTCQLDSRLLCNAMGHPGWAQSINYNTPGMHFWVSFTQKWSQLCTKLPRSEKIYTSSEDYP